MKTVFFIRDIIRKFPFLFFSNILMLVLASLMEAFAIFTIIPVVDLLLKQNLQNSSIITQKVAQVMSFVGVAATMGNFMVIFLAFNILANGLQICVKYLVLKTKYSVLRDLMIGTFEDFFNAKWYFFSHHKQGTLLNTFINEMTIVGDAFGSMTMLFATIVHLILYLAVPFYLSWRVASISLAIALLFALPFVLLGKINYRLGKQNTATANNISAVIQESLTTAKVILGFGNQRKSVKMLNEAFNAHCQATLKSQTLAYAVPLIYYPLALLVIIISLFIAMKFNVALSVTAALLYSLIRVIPIIGQLPTLKNSLDNFFPSYEQVLNLRDSARSMNQKSGQRLFQGFNQEIAIRNLVFAYPGHKPVLSDINIVIPKGKMIALVGKSGAGKSTLIDMIMGFNEPISGQITLDGIPLEEFEIHSYRKRLGYVPQESILFNLTIKDNLLWANSSATDAEIKQACRQANADEFIENFPAGYATLVGDRGVRLSGGQIQRIALARSILRKPDILILDEATSSLDTHSERLIQQAIDGIAKETTVIIIAHRLSTVVNADYIYVIKDGRVIEEGSYARLIQENGEFRSMLQLQALES